MRAAISSRSSQTQWESSMVRCGASPRQKGTVGGWPCASSTYMRPAVSMAAMRQEALPSWMTSPTRGVDGEVLVERGDLVAVGLEDDGDDGGVGDGAAILHSDGARAAACLQAAVDAVAKDVGAVAAA